MEPLIAVIIVAMAVTFSSEFLELIFGWIPIPVHAIVSFLTLPISVLYHYVLGANIPLLVVGSAASSFLALTFGIIVTRLSIAYTEVRGGRRG